MVFQVRNIWTNRVWCLLLVAAVLISGVSPATPQNSKTEPQRRYEEAMSFVFRAQDKEALAAVEAQDEKYLTFLQLAQGSLTEERLSEENSKLRRSYVRE